MIVLGVASLLSCGPREGVLLRERLVERGSPQRWECPPEWLWQPSGGCGPAVLLCADAAHAPIECRGLDLSRPRSVRSDADVGVSFFLRNDGSIGGGWNAREAVPSCPAGWRSAGDGACEPDDSNPCPAGSDRAAGVCISNGPESCPSGEYASLPAEASGAAVVYVNRRGRAMGASGTRDDPYPTIAEALELAPGNAWVLVSEGVWREPLRPTRGVHLIGLCATRSVLDASSATTPAVDVVGPSVVVDLRGFAVRGGTPSLRVSQRGTLLVGAARIEDGTRAAVDVRDASLTLRDVVVRAVRRADAAQYAVGLSASEGADVRIERGLFFDLDDRGMLISTRATVSATDVEIRDTHASYHDAEEGANTAVVNCPDPDELPGPRAADWSGEGVRVEFGGVLRARRFVMTRSANDALTVIHRGSSVEVDDGVIRDTQPLPDGHDGKGAHITGGAHVTLRTSLVARNRHDGISSFCPNTVVDLTEVVVRDVEPRLAGGSAGRGLDAQWGGTIRARRSIVTRAHNAALFSYRGSTIEFTDSAVFDARDSADLFSAAVLAYFESTIRLDRVLIDGFEKAGLVASDSGTSIVLRDVIVAHGRASESGIGLGVAAASGATVTGERLSVIDVPGAGIVAEGQQRGALVRMSNVSITNVTRGVSGTSYYRPFGSADDLSRPRLLVASSNGRLDLDHLRASNSEFGFVIAGRSGAQIVVRDGLFERLGTLGAVIDTTAPASSLIQFENVSALDVSDVSVRSTVR